MLEFYPVPTSLNSSGLMHHQQLPPDKCSISLPITKTMDCNNGKTEVGTIKCEKNYEICEACGQKIQDRFLLKVAESSWHETCLSCCYCGIQLSQTCYIRNSKIYCKTDYDRIFTVKCTRCSNKIQPNDMVMRAQHYIFHLPCFTCCVCYEPLQKGEQFLMRNGQLFCRHDFEKELYLAQQCEEELLLEEMIHHHHHRSRDGRRGPKRPRTILTSAQRKQFKGAFEVSPKPCRKVREALAKDTGLSVRVVQVWFQNQRAKVKKIQRKAKQDGGKNNNESDKEKDDNIKQESPSSDYLGLDNSFSSQPLNPNMPYSPDDFPANSNDSFCSSDSLSLDDFDDQSDTTSLKNSEIHTLSGNGSHENLTSYNSLNPIDKLYSMQDSYFQ